jgi:hypothetical protein
MMWVKGDPARAEAALRRSGIPSSLVVTAPQVKEVPEFVASLSALHVLEALGLAAAVLVIGGLLMYLQSRERSQLVTFGLSHRMGLSRSRYGRSLALELGAILLLAYVVASGLGTAASRVMVPLLDPLGDVPPSPVFLAPVLAMVALGALLVGLAVAWGRVAARSASRADFGEVMRVAD